MKRVKTIWTYQDHTSDTQSFSPRTRRCDDLTNKCHTVSTRCEWKTDLVGKKRLEICEIRGLEASNMHTFPFQERLFGMPDITGLNIIVKAPVGDETDATIEKFRLGINKFGRYPSPNCLIE